MTTEATGLKGLTTGFMGGAEYYNKKIEDLNVDMAELEYKEIAGGGLTGAEETKLVTTRKLKTDAERNKNVQLKAINTVADIYGTSDTGYLENYDDERSSASYRLINYLKQDQDIRPRNTVSEYLGSAAVSSQVSQGLNEVMQEGIEEKDFSKVKRVIVNSAKINKEMTGKFIDTLQVVDFEDKNQTQTILQAEKGRLNSLVAPLGDEKGMALFKELNQGSLIQSKMFSQVRSSLATSKGERDLYSTLEMETGRKLAEIGIKDPYETIGDTKSEYFKKRDIELPKDEMGGLAESTSDKLKEIGITSANQLNQKMSTTVLGLPVLRSGLEVAQKSGKFDKEELAELQKTSESSKKVQSVEKDYNTTQISAFKGFVGAISDNEKTFEKIAKQQSIYTGADLSKLSKGKKQELEYAMERRKESVSDIRGDELTEIAQQKFGKDTALKDLSDVQITELMQDEGVQKLDTFGKMRMASEEFEKSSLALGRVFEATSQSVEKKFNFSLENAGKAVNVFSEGLTTSGDFSKTTMAFIDTLNDSIQTMDITGKGKQFAAAQGFEEMKKDPMAQLAFGLTDIKSVEDLSKVDDEGMTGIDRLRQMGTLSDEQFGQVSTLRSEYEAGEKDTLKAKTMSLQGAEQTAQLAFQASSVGSKEFQNVTSTMLGTN